MSSLIEEFLSAKKSPSTKQKPKSSEYKIDDFLQSLLVEEKKEEHKSSKSQQQQQESSSSHFHLTPYRIRELKKQKKILKVIRTEMMELIAQKKDAFMLLNTLQFFESNLKYFIIHPLEFQRLWFQLPLKKFQKLFLQMVYLYYYADVILLRHELQITKGKEEENQQNWIPFKQQDPLWIQNWLQQEFDSHRNNFEPTLPVDERKVKRVVELIQSQKASNKFASLASPQQQILYNEEELYQLQLQHSMVNHYLLQCNSKEIFIIESLLLQ